MVKGHKTKITFVGPYYFSFFKNTLFKLFISLECKYNKLQFGVVISSTEVSTQKPHTATSCHVYNKTYKRKSIMEHLHSSKRRDSMFPCKHWCLCSFPQQKSIQNCSKSLEAMILDRVTNMSAIVDFVPPPSPFTCMTI